MQFEWDIDDIRVIGDALTGKLPETPEQWERRTKILEQLTGALMAQEGKVN